MLCVINFVSEFISAQNTEATLTATTIVVCIRLVLLKLKLQLISEKMRCNALRV